MVGNHECILASYTAIEALHGQTCANFVREFKKGTCRVGEVRVDRYWGIIDLFSHPTLR